MKTIQQDVLEIAVYSKKGALLADLNLTKEVSLRTEYSEEETLLFVEEAVQDTDMMELLGEKVAQNLSDFEKNSFTTPEVNVIKFSSNPKPMKLKIVGTGIDYNLKTAEIEHDIKIIFPNVELIRENNFTFGSGEVHVPVYKFRVLPYDDEGNLYEMQLKKRKQ